MLLYYLVLIPLSKLPLWLLYKFSDVLYVLIYQIIGYRKKVVYQQLVKVYPNKSAREIEGLAKRFYAHFCDLVIEAIKGFDLSNAEIIKRVKYVNPQVIDRLIAQNRKIIYSAGHYNNWEWAALATPIAIQGKVFAIFAPLKAKFLNQKLKESRTRTGINFIHPKEVDETFEQHKNEAFSMVFLTDQSPSNATKAYWTRFLGQETGVLFGAEKYAKAYDAAVVYGEMRKIKRGYYELEVFLLAEHVQELEYGKVTELHTQAVERSVNKDPAFWLWTHRRWKRSKPV